jgi:hypothetical protein
MIVCHRHRFIFLKTWKTGGTSVELALRSLCGPDDIITPVSEDRRGGPQSPPRNYLHDRAGWSLFDKIAWSLGGNAVLNRRPSVGFFGHVTGVEARKRLSATVWRDYFKFTVERNPWDRQVSQYFWITRRLGDRRPSFKDYLRKAAPMRNWSVYTEDDRLLVDRVIRYDELEDGLRSVVASLGAPEIAAMTRAKGAFRPATDHYREFYDDETRPIIARWYAREIETFGWTF